MNDYQLLIRRIMGICLALLLLSVQQAPLVHAGGNIIATTVDQVRALALLNADRTKNGLKPLVYNGELSKLADDYARDMIERDFFDHNNPEGMTPFDRMDEWGISFRYAGENLAINDSVAGAETSFMKSPAHRDNILNPNFTEVGIGIRSADNGKIYVVQEFIGIN